MPSRELMTVLQDNAQRRLPSHFDPVPAVSRFRKRQMHSMFRRPRVVGLFAVRGSDQSVPAVSGFLLSWTFAIDGRVSPSTLALLLRSPLSVSRTRLR